VSVEAGYRENAAPSPLVIVHTATRQRRLGYGLLAVALDAYAFIMIAKAMPIMLVILTGIIAIAATSVAARAFVNVIRIVVDTSMLRITEGPLLGRIHAELPLSTIREVRYELREAKVRGSKQEQHNLVAIVGGKRELLLNDELSKEECVTAATQINERLLRLPARPDA
jgi:hypothetical protein